MASVNDVFTVFLLLVGTGGASTGLLYWLLNQPVFEDLIPIKRLNSVLNVREISERFYPRCITFYPA
jgi:hypothetical protein